jgi:hypothetical protein
MQLGRLDLISRDDAGACYHCEEQRHMTNDNLLILSNWYLFHYMVKMERLTEMILPERLLITK